MIAIYLIIGLLVIRGIETYRFVKSISKLCYKYDWKVINENPDFLLIKMADKDYHLTSKWSAYNFLWLNGPSVLTMFFSFKSMTIENHYNKRAVERINKYEII